MPGAVPLPILATRSLHAIPPRPMTRVLRVDDMAGDPIGSEIQITPAEEGELPACFALLPMLAAPEANVFAARGADGTLLGAGGLLWRNWGTPPGMPTWIHVLPDSRRRGLGRRLLAILASHARAEADFLWAALPIDEESEPAAFARACGASCRKRQLYFQSDADAFVGQLDTYVARLAATDRIPDGVIVRPLAEADVEQVKWLIAEVMESPPPQIGLMLARGMVDLPESAPVDRERSCVMTIGGELVGALLSRRIPGENASHVVCNVIDPRWRRGWANPVLLHRFTRTSIDQGCTRIGFDCAEDVRDTIGLARRSGADHVRSSGMFAYATAAAND